jgi:hypothetical protein
VVFKRILLPDHHARSIPLPPPRWGRRLQPSAPPREFRRQ